MIVFFFFQAEDGIRDYKVTGVQTCALPISLPEDYKKWLRALYKSSYAFRDKMDIDGANHYKRMFDITDGLVRRGYSDADIELILGGNFRRALAQIWG